MEMLGLKKAIGWETSPLPKSARSCMVTVLRMLVTNITWVSYRSDVRGWQYIWQKCHHIEIEMLRMKKAIGWNISPLPKSAYLRMVIEMIMIVANITWVSYRSDVRGWQCTYWTKVALHWDGDAWTEKGDWWDTPPLPYVFGRGWS